MTSAVVLDPQIGQSTDLSLLGRVTAFTRSTDIRGALMLSASLDLDPAADPYPLLLGTDVRVLAGSKQIWHGTLTEADPGEPWTLQAQGIQSSANTFIARPGSDQNLLNLGAVLTNAMSDGWRINGYANLPTLPTTASVRAGGTVAEILATAEQISGQRWAIDVTTDILSFAPIPTVASRVIVLAAPPGGKSSEDFANSIVPVYANAAAPSSSAPSGYYVGTNGSTQPYVGTPVEDPVSIARHGRFQRTYDMTGLGPVTTAQAQAAAQGLLTQTAYRPRFTAGVTAGRYDITSLGGAKIDPAREIANVVYRVAGVYDTDLSTFLAGQVEYDEDTEVVTITPDQNVSRDLATLLSPQAPAQGAPAAVGYWLG